MRLLARIPNVSPKVSLMAEKCEQAFALHLKAKTSNPGTALQDRSFFKIPCFHWKKKKNHVQVCILLHNILGFVFNISKLIPYKFLAKIDSPGQYVAFSCGFFFFFVLPVTQQLHTPQCEMQTIINLLNLHPHILSSRTWASKKKRYEIILTFDNEYWGVNN